MNRQSDTHAVGIYSTPLKVCVMAWLAIGTPTGTVYTYPQHLPLQCLWDTRSNFSGSKSPKTKRQRRIP